MRLLLCVVLAVASELEDRILSYVNNEYQLITGRNESHFSLQETAWTEFISDNSRVQAVLLLNNSDNLRLSLHYFEFSILPNDLRLLHHSGPQELGLESKDEGLVTDAIRNTTNETVSSFLFLAPGKKQEIPMQPYQNTELQKFELVSREYFFSPNVVYVATFLNCTGEIKYYSASTNESAIFANLGTSTGSSLLSLAVVFILSGALTYAGLVCYWRQNDSLPCQKRKEESARMVLDSNAVKSVP